MWIKKSKGKKGLAAEILGLAAISLTISFLLFRILSACAVIVADHVLQDMGTVWETEQWLRMEGWCLQVGFLISALFFVMLFLFLLGERLSYISEIFRGIDALKNQQEGYCIPLEGRNELTSLAEQINLLSAEQSRIRKRERELQEEKEELIRTLSHDIRTPLTSIMAYTEYMMQQTESERSEEADRKEYLSLILRKAGQIRDLTEVLLSGCSRFPEYFEDAGLLMEQLAAEFEELLEEEFQLSLRLETGAFSGSFDVQEMRRIFDNLASNVQKYADHAEAVGLTVCLEEEGLVICQTNKIRQHKDREGAESYQIGLRSIRRIIQSYGGSVKHREEDGYFSIRILIPCRRKENIP